MYLTGRRVAETTNYKKTDVTMNGFIPTELHIRKEITKTKKKDGTIYIQGELSSLIRESLRDNKTEWLFVNQNGRKCWKDGIYKYLRRASKQVIGAAITPHHFRKRYLTVNIPKSMKDAMVVSGLEDTKVAMNHYAQSTPEGQGKVLEMASKRG